MVNTRLIASILIGCGIYLAGGVVAKSDPVQLESSFLQCHIDSTTGKWSLRDRESNVRWPTEGSANPGPNDRFEPRFEIKKVSDTALHLVHPKGMGIHFELEDQGRSLRIRYEGQDIGAIHILQDALEVTDTEGGFVIVPCREGLLIPAASGVAFEHQFGSSAYEGCHMNMLGFHKCGSGLIVSWEDTYTTAIVQRRLDPGQTPGQRLITQFHLRRSARSLCLTPTGPGDWNTIAIGYRRLAEQKGLAVTLSKKIERNARAERLLGASNVKLWTCLARRMNEASTEEESVQVHWTFDEAAAIAEHLHNDLEIDRCLFMLGGWTEGGYDCRHPDNLPANPECGGNDALAAAIDRIQNLAYVACLHDNYQDMYRDAKSWDPKYIQKRPDGSLVQGGRWLGGRAYIVCAAKQLELALRPQNLPAVHKLFGPWSYFIDTTYAAGPQVCADPNHPLDGNADIAWKIRLSDAARDLFGLFGSECGREWAIPYSDFFEGLVGVSGKYYHSLDPARLGAIVIPFWEMVYHDCEFCYGKYGYSAEQAAEYVAHHVLCARPLHYHSIPNHRYWLESSAGGTGPLTVTARPRVRSVRSTGEREFEIDYVWEVLENSKLPEQVAPRVFTHFVAQDAIRFQDDHDPDPAVRTWRKDQTILIGPHRVRIPTTVNEDVVDVYIGLYQPTDPGFRYNLPGADSASRVFAGRLHLKPDIQFESAENLPTADRSCYTRTDNGWAEGRHPIDAFIKNTHEILGPLHRATGCDRLQSLELLGPDQSVRRATYGQGKQATVVTVNFGQQDATIETGYGGSVLLPPWGFVIECPQFIAFHANRWNGIEYPRGALFTIQPADTKDFDTAHRLRIFHGFGTTQIHVLGRSLDVAREATVELK